MLPFALEHPSGSSIGAFGWVTVYRHSFILQDSMAASMEKASVSPVGAEASLLHRGASGGCQWGVRGVRLVAGEQVCGERCYFECERKNPRQAVFYPY